MSRNFGCLFFFSLKSNIAISSWLVSFVPSPRNVFSPQDHEVILLFSSNLEALWFYLLQFRPRSRSVVSNSGIPWTAARQASLSITNSQSLLKLMSIKSVMTSNHLILCHPLLLLAFNLSQHQGLFQWVTSDGQNIGVSASISVFPKNTRTDLL